jgi:excisionase family DNA binding protein
MASTLHNAPRNSAADTPFKLLDSLEAANALGIGKRTLQEKVAAREIGCIKIGRAIRFHPDDLAAFIERNRVKAQGWRKGQHDERG